MSSTMKQFAVVQPRRQTPARELHDLGISRAQARFEASRPIWDLGDPASRGR